MNVKVYILCCRICKSDRQILTNVEERILKAGKDLLGVEIDGMMICNSCCKNIEKFAAFKADVLKIKKSSSSENMVTSSVSPTKTRRKKHPKEEKKVKKITLE